MHHAALIQRIGKHLVDGLCQAKASISDDQPSAVQTPIFQGSLEANPAVLVFTPALGSADNLAISIAIDTNRNQDGDTL